MIRDRLNVSCPYCHQQCRIGMAHDCEAAPHGCRRIEIERLHGKIIAIVYGDDDD